MERAEGVDYSGLYEALHGTSAVFTSDTGNAPAKLIKDFRKGGDRPILKGAFVEQSSYLGDNMLETLVNIKSKNELVADIVALLQSPAKNVISALQSGKHTIAGLVKTLSEKQS
jgi:large subunit ribosomal protein L10